VARTILKTTALLAALLLVVAVGLASRGSIDTVGDDPGAVVLSSPPTWAKPCQDREPRHDRELLETCARVAGRVLAVRAEAGQTGPPEVHLAMIADFHLFVVKLAPGQGRPSLGSTVTVVGPLVRASNGLREIDASGVTEE
jgi:hypothetical protein